MSFSIDIPASLFRFDEARTQPPSGARDRSILSPLSTQFLWTRCPAISYLPASALGVTETFGERLRRLRTERGVTVVDLAAAVGAAEGTIRQIENGSVKWPNFNLGLRLADQLNVDPRYLALGEGFSMSQRFDAIDKRLTKLEQRMASISPKRR